MDKKPGGIFGRPQFGPPMFGRPLFSIPGPSRLFLPGPSPNCCGSWALLRIRLFPISPFGIWASTGTPAKAWGTTTLSGLSVLFFTSRLALAAFLGIS